MEKTFILGNSSSLKQLGGTYLEIPSLINEIEIHDWVVELFHLNEIDKVVIEIEKEPKLSLKIGYHIRLSIANLKERALVPILYVSKLSLNSIILQTEIYGQLFSTKGVVFTEFELQSNKAEIECLSGLNQSEYLTKFLKIIHIQPDETLGRHSLANIWGAHAMDKSSKSNALSDDSDFKKELYFKYISAFNIIDLLKPFKPDNITDNKSAIKNSLKVVGSINKKRILLIDDEASKGWEVVLRKVFKTVAIEDFVVIDEKVKDYDSLSEASRHVIENDKFDLYLVDLRLNGLEEDENSITEDFSGMKVLKKIKSINQGNQVIVFTASNKVWNLKALLEAGADNYYMKESPEYNFSTTVSDQNYKDFKANVATCFERSYLREIFSVLEKTKTTNTNSDDQFITESDVSLVIAWEQIKNNYLDFGFLTLFMSLESYANKLYKIDEYEDSLEGEVTIDKTDSEQYEWLLSINKDHQNGGYFSSKKEIQETHIKPTTIFKVSCLFKIKYKKDDAFLKSIGKLNKLRNNIAHGKNLKSVTKDNIKQIITILGEVRKN
jgi:CheY-like chemotaxis protein